MEAASRRLSLLQAQVTSQPKLQHEVVICAAFRTPLTKGKKGGLRDTPIEAMLAPVLRKILEVTRINPSEIGDIAIGNVLNPGSGAVSSRMAQFLAGIPHTTTNQTLNRQCSSGLQAVSTIANAIRSGEISVGIGGGFESMSMTDMSGSVDPEKISQEVFDNEVARNCLMPMGITSENVAERFNISRTKQDQLSADSHAKAAAAQEQGLFDYEIVPVNATVKDEKGNLTSVLVSKDDGIRKETTVQTLGKLRPAFKPDGATTAGNSSQVSDGAAAVLLASREAALRLGLPIIGRWVGFAVAGVPPEIMGIGPAVAIPKVLEQTGLTLNDISVIELNEAFASQAVYCIEHLGIDYAKVNPKGGAIAFGHPLGATGARQIATLLPELKRRGARYGLVSMCIGTGMGAAAVIENISS
jgi:acetyl-CoA acyltransferase 1